MKPHLQLANKAEGGRIKLPIPRQKRNGFLRPSHSAILPTLPLNFFRTKWAVLTHNPIIYAQ
jgi:hypothetical protein